MLHYFSIPGFFNAPLAWESIPQILHGLPMSIYLTAISFVGSLILGLFLTLAQLSHWRLLHWLSRAYISFMRGVPILVVLFIIYFGFGANALPAAILSFTLVSAAFVSEVFRSAFMGIDHGQYEAAYSLGLSYRKVIHYIILPQAFRIGLPALGNILLDMFKNTSLAAMITVSEMFMDAKIVAGANQDYMTIYITIAILYWLCCVVLTAGQNWLERAFDYQRRADRALRHQS
ncbi:amino acid ABC transporter permease [Levilactobacillus suantsaii]|uniref:Amino acid ABC transporter permease n=1 Tax=Levilactobacillus suantsaii TaxID=2292255 RepID=A0A4Q0VJG9_9LACO|nr:amino acid ABC transporter permease [Levilactobacillus suantsaii]RXI79687.1 amino acid ABC transporter permease [Levilactobacillus suantsaii]